MRPGEGCLIKIKPTLCGGRWERYWYTTMHWIFFPKFILKCNLSWKEEKPFVYLFIARIFLKPLNSEKIQEALLLMDLRLESC
jgi:hypothetical protein